MAEHPPDGPVVHNAEQLRQLMAEKQCRDTAQTAPALNEQPSNPGKS